MIIAKYIFSCQLAAKYQAGIITISDGKGTKQLSKVININIQKYGISKIKFLTISVILLIISSMAFYCKINIFIIIIS
jgi:hypothetical protein